MGQLYSVADKNIAKQQQVHPKPQLVYENYIEKTESANHNI